MDRYDRKIVYYLKWFEIVRKGLKVLIIIRVFLFVDGFVKGFVVCI